MHKQLQAIITLLSLINPAISAVDVCMDGRRTVAAHP
jgi:hypothetical protein